MGGTLPPPIEPDDILPTSHPHPINISKPTRTEIRNVIKKLKTDKAPGPDSIPPEAIKADVETSEMLTNSLSRDAPEQWKDGHLIKIPKKGNLKECKNHRGIMLLLVPGKVLNRIILDRLTTTLDAELRYQQAGFRKDRSCTDHIATPRIIVEQTLEWFSLLYVNFVDFQKAFDSLDSNQIIMETHETLRYIRETYHHIIQKLYQPLTCQVVPNGFLSKPFSVDTGVRHCFLLSPLLFLMAVDWIMCKTTEAPNLGLQWTPWSKLDDLDFADDIALVSHNQHSKCRKNHTTGQDINQNLTRY